MNKQQSILYGLFAVTLGLTAWTALNDTPEAANTLEPVSIATKKREPSQPRTNEVVLREQASLSTHAAMFRPPITSDGGNLFAINALVDATASANPAPTEAHFPFQYVGKIVDQGGTRIFLTDGVQNIVAGEKSVLDQTWKVMRIQLPIITVRHLPTKKNMTVTLEEQH